MSFVRYRPSWLRGSKNQIMRPGSEVSPTTRTKGFCASGMPTAQRAAASMVLPVDVEEMCETAFMGRLDQGRATVTFG